MRRGGKMEKGVEEVRKDRGRSESIGTIEDLCKRKREEMERSGGGRGRHI